MASLDITAGQSVLVLWSGAAPSEDFQESVAEIKGKVANGHVQMEHMERLAMASHANSSFDVAITGILQPSPTVHNSDILGEVCRILKPSGKLFIGEVITASSDEGKEESTSKLSSTLKLAGFVNVATPTPISLSDDSKSELAKQLGTNTISLVQVTATKPNYEVGSSTQLKLNFAKKKGSGVFAKVDIEKGRLLTHYDEEIITKEEGEKRHATYSDRDGSFLFFFSYKGKKLCIDATFWSGMGRMINDNHKKPKVVVEGDGERPILNIYSVRPIKTGEEICFDYNDKSTHWRKKNAKKIAIFTPPVTPKNAISPMGGKVNMKPLQTLQEEQHHQEHQALLNSDEGEEDYLVRGQSVDLEPTLSLSVSKQDLLILKQDLHKMKTSLIEPDPNSVDSDDFQDFESYASQQVTKPPDNVHPSGDGKHSSISHSGTRDSIADGQFKSMISSGYSSQAVSTWTLSSEDSLSSQSNNNSESNKLVKKLVSEDGSSGDENRQNLVSAIPGIEEESLGDLKNVGMEISPDDTFETEDLADDKLMPDVDRVSVRSSGNDSSGKETETEEGNASRSPLHISENDLRSGEDEETSVIKSHNVNMDDGVSDHVQSLTNEQKRKNESTERIEQNLSNKEKKSLDDSTMEDSIKGDGDALDISAVREDLDNRLDGSKGSDSSSNVSRVALHSDSIDDPNNLEAMEELERLGGKFLSMGESQNTSISSSGNLPFGKITTLNVTKGLDSSFTKCDKQSSDHSTPKRRDQKGSSNREQSVSCIVTSKNDLSDTQMEGKGKRSSLEHFSALSKAAPSQFTGVGKSAGQKIQVFGMHAGTKGTAASQATGGDESEYPDDESEYPDDYNWDYKDIDDSDNDPNFDPEKYASDSDDGNDYEFNSDSDSPLKSFSGTTSNTDADDDMSVNPSSSCPDCDLEGYVSDSDHSDVIPVTDVPDLGVHLNKSDGGNRSKPKFGVCPKKEKKDGCKQVYDKIHFCTFCGAEIKSKISRHLLKVHRNNPEISRICMLPKRSKERMIRLEILENEGNFRHNIEVLRKQCVVLVVARREAGENHDVTEYLPCEYCKKFMLKRSLWNHHRKCPVMYYYKTSDYTVVDEGTESSNNAVRRGRNLLYSSLMNDPDQYLTTLLLRMRDDHLKDIVIKDKLIKRYAALRVESLGNKSDQKTNDIYRVSQGASTLARLVFAAQEKYPECNISLKSLLKPEHFDKVVSITKEMALKEQNSPTSLGRYIGNLLGHAIQIKIGETLRANNLEACQEGKHFQKLYVAEWNYRVNSACTKRLNTIQRKKVKTIPLTEDLLKLHKFTSDKIALMSKMLNQSKNAVHWRELAHLTMCRLIMFNKRRRAEVKDLKVEDYISRPKWQDNQNGEFDMALSTSSRMLAKRMDMVIAAGKSRKNVDAYVLLPPDVKAAVDILLKYREEVGIPKTNPYIFARKNSDTPYSGNTELKKLADSCPGLEHPERITSNHLRKYIATVSQILDMTDNEIEMLAIHLGHDPKTHKENYRLAHSTRELAQVSQLLLLVEEGDVNKWKGRKLSEIPVEDLPLEVPEDTDEGEDSIDKDLVDYRLDDDNHKEAEEIHKRKRTHERDTNDKKRRKRWSEEENTIFRRIFSKFITTKTMPPTTLLKVAEQELSRGIPQIRSRVHNVISRKASSLTLS